MIKPFCIIPKIKFQFTIFLVVIIVGGHIGITAGWLTNLGKITFKEFVLQQFASGVLFNMAITFLVSAIFPILIELMDGNEVKFKGLKMSTFAISTIFLMYCIVFLSTVDISNVNETIWLQILMYLASLLLTIYIFLLPYLDRDYERYSDLDDKKRTAMKDKSATVSTDGRGVKA